MGLVSNFFVFFIVFFSLPNASLARSGKSIRNFIPLKKITVGPYDNFQSSVSADESSIYFTRSQNLSSQVIKIDVRTGASVPITKAEVDAKNPAISPNGQNLAVTFFGNDAKGDICLQGNETKLTCITGQGLGEHSPFWIDNDSLGYVQSDDRNDTQRIFVYNIVSKSSTLLIEGQIYGPSISSTRKLLAYKSTSPEFVLYDMEQRSEVKRIPINLPGNPGVAKFSSDGDYLYFAQYMLDSNRDLTLDSRDAAAIFRISINEKDPQPEQLTSLDQNCSYPTPAKSSLYITCAFEGSLDVYKAQLSGITPASWSVDELWEAHRAARSYSDKILLLHQIKSKNSILTTEDFDQRLFNNFVFMHAWMPAMHFAQKLKNTSGDYAVQLILLETLNKWDALPSKENVAELGRLLATAEAELLKLPTSPMGQIVKAYLEFFRSRNASALQIAQEAKALTPIGLYWQTRLLERILGDKPGLDFDAILAARIRSGSENEETRFYYLSRLLSRQEENKDRDNELLRLETDLKQATDSIAKQLLDIVQNERQIYRVLLTDDKTTVRNEMREVVDRVKRIQNSYFALRLLFSRSIVLLQKNDRPRELSQMMSLWLSYINPKSKEYPYAIEALRFTSLEAAYKFYNGPEATKDLAKGSFYSSIRTTDDLESHFQYTLLNSSNAAWNELLKVYETMVKDGLVEGDSLVFVKAVRAAVVATDKTTDSALANATSEIEKISDDLVGVGVKYLYLGYLYHEQLMRNAKDFDIDNDLAQKAHRSYLFAIDAAHDNERIQAAALQNLALLHLSLRNYSMAAEFFQKRHKLPFTSIEQQEALTWFEAKSLYQSYRTSEALSVIEETLKITTQNRTAFLEKQAFYAWNAGQYEKSAELYEDLIPRIGKKANSGIYLSYGYALMKSGKTTGAEVALLKSINLAQSESSITIKGIRRSPEKIQFTARGLLARLPLTPQKQKAYLIDRLKMFDQMISQAKTYYLDPVTLRSQEVKEQFDLAILQLNGDESPEQGMAAITKGLQLAQDFGDAQGFLNQTVFNSLKNSMLILRKTSAYRNQEIAKILAKLNKQASLDFAEEKTPSNQLRKQWAEIELVRLAYHLGQREDFAKVFSEESDKILSETNLTELGKERQDLMTSVKDYRDRMIQNL
jgi:Tol biopolymer transport system component